VEPYLQLPLWNKHSEQVASSFPTWQEKEPNHYLSAPPSPGRVLDGRSKGCPGALKLAAPEATAAKFVSSSASGFFVAIVAWRHTRGVFLQQSTISHSLLPIEYCIHTCLSRSLQQYPLFLLSFLSSFKHSNSNNLALENRKFLFY